MNKRIFAIFMTLVMIGTIFVIAPSDLQVGASGGGGDNGFGLDYDYIRSKTENLSQIIFDVKDHGLDKGRAFGTEGERAAAGYIAGWMGNLGLYDPGGEEGWSLSYRDQIQNISVSDMVRKYGNLSTHIL